MKTFFKWLNTNRDSKKSTLYGPFRIIYKDEPGWGIGHPYLQVHTENGWYEVPLFHAEDL